MTFSKQLELYLQRRFGSAGDKRMMAEQSGIDYDYFVAILAGSRNPPSEEKIIEMGKRLKLTDEEVGLLLALSLKAKAKFPETKNVLDRALAYGNNSGGVKFIELPKTDYHTVPVWASVQAGTGQLTEQNAEVVDEVLIAEEEYKAKCFAIQITGASMEPEIKDGDIGIFEPPNGLQPAENDVVIVELEGHGQWMIKRLKIIGPNKIDLVSSNEGHPPIRVNLDAQKIEIKGILLRTVRKFKKRLFLK